MKVMLKEYPAVAEAMAVRHIKYNQQMQDIKEREQRGEVLVIRPPETLGIKRTENDPMELERVYQIGRIAGNKALSAVKDFLNWATS